MARPNTKPIVLSLYHQQSLANMIVIYLKKLLQKAEYIRSMVESRRKWEETELIDWQEARQDATTLAKRREWLERDHHLSILKTKQKIQTSVMNGWWE